MDSERLHDALTRAGLTEYQADAYLSLIEMGSAPVVEVAEHAAIPASQAYDVVRRLEDRGFAETIERDRLHARAVEPDAALAELRELGDLLTDAADEVEDRWEEPDATSHQVGVVKRRETVLGRTEAAVEEAEVSVELAATVEQFRRLRPVVEDAADRGVVVRVALYAPIEDVELGESAVTELRVASAPGPFVAVVDRRLAFFSHTLTRADDYGVVVDDDVLAFVLHWYFLVTTWMPFDAVYRAPDGDRAYVSIEEFVYDVSRTWHGGATVELAVSGHDNETGEAVELRGELVEILAQDNVPPPPDVAFEALMGHLSLVLDVDDDLVTVGGWGSKSEEVEAEVIRVEAIRRPPGDLDRPT